MTGPKGALVSYADPYVPSIDLGGKTFSSMPVRKEVLEAADCVVVLTDHSTFDYSMIAVNSPLVVDCRNALRGFDAPHIQHL